VVKEFALDLNDFEKLIGGQQYTPKIIPIFEKLCYSDDSSIRDIM
jgi:hypothetical protein